MKYSPLQYLVAVGVVLGLSSCTSVPKLRSWKDQQFTLCHTKDLDDSEWQAAAIGHCPSGAKLIGAETKEKLASVVEERKAEGEEELLVTKTPKYSSETCRTFVCSGPVFPKPTE